MQLACDTDEIVEWWWTHFLARAETRDFSLVFFRGKQLWVQMNNVSTMHLPHPQSFLLEFAVSVSSDISIKNVQLSSTVKMCSVQCCVLCEHGIYIFHAWSSK